MAMPDAYNVRAARVRYRDGLGRVQRRGARAHCNRQRPYARGGAQPRQLFGGRRFRAPFHVRPDRDCVC